MREIFGRIRRFFEKSIETLFSSNAWVFVWRTGWMLQAGSRAFVQSRGNLRIFHSSAAVVRKAGDGFFPAPKRQRTETLGVLFLNLRHSAAFIGKICGEFLCSIPVFFLKIGNAQLWHDIQTFFLNFRYFCPVNGQVAFRAIAVVFLTYTLTSMSFPQNASLTPIRKQVSGRQIAQIGVGGGEFSGKNAVEGLTEASWLLETSVLEPESFSKPRTLLYDSYKVQRGDMIGDLAVGFGLNQDTLISLNNVKNTRLLQIGQVLRIPNQDGIMYTVKKGDTVDAIAEKYQSNGDAVRIANELFSDAVPAGVTLFIPGAKLDWMERQEINGDLFIWPAAGYITSPYGYRNSPFGGNRQFHSGLDIGAPMGAAVRAAMSGRVSSVGWDDVLGNYVVISHHSGYRTMYAHMSVIRVKSGAYVGTGERIGDIGSTGQSTGPHVHFTVFKNGVTVNPRSLMR